MSVEKRNYSQLMVVGLGLFMEMPPKMFSYSSSAQKKEKKGNSKENDEERY